MKITPINWWVRPIPRYGVWFWADPPMYLTTWWGLIE